MEYRRATRADIDAFLDVRMEFVTNICQSNNSPEFRVNSQRYFEEHIDSDDFLLFLAVEDGQIISSCLACLYHILPVPSSFTGNSAEIYNVYTRADRRGEGHAETVLRMLIDEAKRLGVDRFELTYTPDGLHLYEKLGFKPVNEQMQLKV